MHLLIEAANHAIAVTDGVIGELQGPFDQIIRVPEGDLRPGLINAHDHLRLNHFGRLGRPPYDNAYLWARDIQAREKNVISRGRNLPRRGALLHGAWKNLLAGVTHVMHHDFWEADFDRDFPIQVLRIPFADSLGMTPDIAPPPDQPFAMHVAEGIDTAAADEIRTIAARGLLTPNLIAVHLVGLDADGIALMRESGCALTWCPTSNQFLFGRTASAALLTAGCDVLLGTDSLLTGAGDLLDELRYARTLKILSDACLLDAVGAVAARRFGLPQPSLSTGAVANLAVFRKPILDADAGDVALVIAGGKLRVLDPTLAPVPPHGRIIRHKNFPRWIDEDSDIGGSDIRTCIG
ncbi:MAG TPA: amidohydrolase family protein [Rhizomicrobium sp.]|jgi:hypothetical protein